MGHQVQWQRAAGISVRIAGAAIAVVILTAQGASACMLHRAGIGMKGGGWVDDPDFNKAHLGLALPCDPTGSAANLEINRDGAQFHLEQMTSATCSFNDPEDPQTGGSHEGTGLGRYNGEPAMVDWKFVDAGDQRGPARARGFAWTRLFPGLADQADQRGDLVQVNVTPLASTEPPLSVSGPLLGGQIYMGWCVP